jgi:hypothetical protein
MEWDPGTDRAKMFIHIRQAQRELHDFLVELQERRGNNALLPGLDLRQGAGFGVENVRPARRIGANGEFHTEMVVEIVQTDRHHARPDGSVPPRGGSTLVIDLEHWNVRYAISKRLYERPPTQPNGNDGILARRLIRQQELAALAVAMDSARGADVGNLAEWLAATYACKARVADRKQREPFAMLHRSLE